MAKNLILGQILARFGPDLVPPNFFSWVLLLLDVTHCHKLSSYAISRKINEPNLRKWQKNLVSGPILAPLAQVWALNFFSWVLPLPDVRHCLEIIIICNFKEN